MVERIPARVGEIAIPVEPVPADLSIDGVDAMLQADPAMPGLIVRSPDGTLGLLSRAAVENAMLGGACSPFRRSAADIASTDALVISSTCEVDEAGRLALARTGRSRETDLIATWPDGRLGIVPLSAVMATMVRRYAKLTNSDTLTGLHNRHELSAATARRLDAGNAGLLLFDLDRFADINDALGHDAGDELLRRLGAELTAAAAPHLVARLGGDEFAVLVADSDPERLSALAWRLLARLRGPYRITGVPISIEACVGIAHGGPHEVDATALMRRATAAVRTGKRLRSTVEVWNPHEESARAADLRLLTELRGAIPEGQLRLHYQPLVAASTGAVHGFEALVRWEHPDRGLVPPGQFIPLAERSDVIVPMSDWTMAEAIRQAAEWHRAGWSAPVSVNVSAAYLAQDRMVATIVTLLDLHDLPTSLLTVEITESAVMAEPTKSAQRLAALRGLGVRISIDDFGTGYTSLAQLTDLPVDELKIDRSFVMRIGESQPHAAIVRVVTDMGHSLGFSVVAEGVEDAATADGLRAYGVNLLQGYHFGRPAPAAEAVSLLRAGQRHVPVDEVRELGAVEEVLRGAGKSVVDQRH